MDKQRWDYLAGRIGEWPTGLDPEKAEVRAVLPTFQPMVGVMLIGHVCQSLVRTDPKRAAAAVLELWREGEVCVTPRQGGRFRVDLPGGGFFEVAEPQHDDPSGWSGVIVKLVEHSPAVSANTYKVFFTKNVPSDVREMATLLAADPDLSKRNASLRAAQKSDGKAGSIYTRFDRLLKKEEIRFDPPGRC